MGHKLHNNFAVAGAVMNVLRVYASNFAEKNADNHDELKNEKYAPVLWGVLKKRKGKLKARCPHIFTSTHSCVYSLLSQECCCSTLTLTLQKSK